MPKRRRKSSVVVAVNPKSGTGHRLGLVQELCERLHSAGFETQVHQDLDAIISATEAAVQADDLHAVVSAGGDGTAGLLVNRLPPGFPLAILPLGTENLLAKHLGIRSQVASVAEIIEGGQTVSMDVGRANGQLFLVMASCGFDADVVRRLHGQRRGNIRHWSYLRPLWESITRYRYPSLRVFIDGQSLPTQPSWAFVFNVPRYAMNLPIAPEANAFDGLLDVCTYRNGSFWNGLRYLAAMILRWQRHCREVTHHCAQAIRIESDQEVPYQLDGDPGGTLPLQIDVLPNYLRIMVPASQPPVDHRR